MNDKYKVDEDGKAIIPDGTTIIDGFSYNESLISIVIPDGVTEIYSGAFEHCWSLESNDKTLFIHKSWLIHADTLESYNVGDSLKIINSGFDKQYRKTIWKETS